MGRLLADGYGALALAVSALTGLNRGRAEPRAARVAGTIPNVSAALGRRAHIGPGLVGLRLGTALAQSRPRAPLGPGPASG